MNIPRRKIVVDFTPKLDKKGVCINPEVLSKTVQSEKDSCDINRIMKNHKENGGFIGDPFRKALNPEGGILDLTAFGNDLEIQNQGAIARNIFSTLPEELKKMFGYDVMNYYNFMADEANNVLAVKLGLKDPSVLEQAKPEEEAAAAPAAAAQPPAENPV